MSSSFSGYSIALSGMQVNQSALSVVSSNIANLDTSGYSRKQVNSAELAIAHPGGESEGIGVRLAEVRRARDIFLDQTYRTYNAKSSYLGTKSGNIEDIQRALNEFTASDDGDTTNGLQQTLENFFSSWEELIKDPSNRSNRQSMLENASTMISAFQDCDEQLLRLQLDGVTNARTEVEKVNELSQKVADLYLKIKQAELGGAEAGDLRDERDSLLDQLSNLTNISTYEYPNGLFEVTINGLPLVRGGQVHPLEVEGEGTSAHPLRLLWAESGIDAGITGGSIRAYLEDSDQSSLQDITSIPYNFSAGSLSSIVNLRQGLNDLFTTVATKINELHQSGHDLNGDDGLDFFTVVDATQPLSLSNAQVNTVLVNDPNKVVTSTTGAKEEHDIATQIVDLTKGENFQFEGLDMDLYGFYNSLISWVGTLGENVGSYSDTQKALVLQVDNRRQNISSVSLEEEMTKMIMYQNAYSASAKVMSTVDSLLAGLIEDFGSR